MHEIVVESEGKRTFIDQTDPAIACTRCCTCRGEEERSDGIAIVRANGGAHRLWEKREEEKGSGGSWDRWAKREDEDLHGRYVRGGTNVRGWSLASYYFTRATKGQELVAAGRLTPRLTNGPSDNLCRLTHPVEICLRYTAAFSTTSRGRPFRVLSLLPPFTARSTRLSAVYRILPRLAPPRLNRF